MTNTIKIGNRIVGQGYPAFIIAEIAQAHGGSLDAAHAYIDAVSATGADAVKFQTHNAAFESTLDEPFRVRLSGRDKTRYDYWKRMEFTAGQWAALKKHANRRGLIFLSSAFSVQSVDLLRRMGMPAWKAGSGEFKSYELLEAMGKTGMPILFSTGMSTNAEIERAVKWFRKRRFPFALFQTTSCYPTPMEKAGINVLEGLRTKFNCPVGLSDHSGSIFPSLLALARGADLIEVHAVLDRKASGPDATSSLTMDEIKTVVEAEKAFCRLDNNPVNKDKMAKSLSRMRKLFTKSVAPLHDLPAGTVLKKDMLTAKKPGTGIPYEEVGKLVNARLARNVKADRIIKWKDIDTNE